MSSEPRIVEMPIESSSLSDLDGVARQLRRDVITMSYLGHHNHVGSSYSVVDILTALYFRALKVDPASPRDPNRDRLILSKGHGCAALYAALARRGFFPVDLLNTYCRDGGAIGGHPEAHQVPGIEVTTGALGHGLPMGMGIALAGKIDSREYRVFVVMSDGECDEGTVWEAALAAPHFRLDNLVAVIDYNRLQALGPVDEVMPLEPMVAKWESFGWSVREVDGHDFAGLASVFEGVPFTPGKPSLVIAHTIKGKGVSFMEGRMEWHYIDPKREHWEAAMRELADRSGES